jgi:NAD(P)-dependent dehydrogenase (short-subunit alcohol dehydrogenase family)
LAAAGLPVPSGFVVTADTYRSFIEETAERYGRIDVLVNNARVQTETTVTEATIEDWEFVVKVMPEGGAIVNMSPNHTFLTIPGLFPYNAVNAGINEMTRTLALELGPWGLRVKIINPGWIGIERTREEFSADDHERVEAMPPLGRIETLDDVAATVSFLTGDEASFITGVSLLVDGGRSAVM